MDPPKSKFSADIRTEVVSKCLAHSNLSESSIRGGLTSLWLYKENNKLRDRKNIFTLHIPP
jgi:hypothetical protein